MPCRRSCVSPRILALGVAVTLWQMKGQILDTQRYKYIQKPYTLTITLCRTVIGPIF